MTTQTTIDLEALRRTIEERDAAGMLALYADDAEVRLVDRNDTPGNPRVLSGKDEIRGFVEDVCAPRHDPPRRARGGRRRPRLVSWRRARTRMGPTCCAPRRCRCATG